MKKEKYEYLILTTTIFVVGFVLYGCVGVVAVLSDVKLFNIANPYISWIVAALFGGYSFFSILSGLLFTIKWISKKSLKTKLLLTVFFCIPIWLAMAGIFYSIPYWIYNFIQYRKIPNNKN